MFVPCCHVLLGTDVNFTAHERRTMKEKLGLDHAAVDFVSLTLKSVTLQARNDGKSRCFACIENITFVREQGHAELRPFIGVCSQAAFPPVDTTAAA